MHSISATSTPDLVLRPPDSRCRLRRSARSAKRRACPPRPDARGNLTFDPTTGRSFGYWSENELVAASGGLGFGHDAFHRILDNLVNGAVTVQFVHDGPHMIAAYVPGSGLAERFVRGDGPDELIATYTGSGTTDRRWAHQDERGSVIALSDGAGNAAAINRYDDYGQPQSTNQGRFQYTGQLWLPQIGLYHYKNRNYDPAMGRFMQTDPIGYAAGPNLYAYVGNDPVNWTDPLGLDPPTPPGFGGFDPCVGSCTGTVTYDDDAIVFTTTRRPDPYGMSYEDWVLSVISSGGQAHISNLSALLFDLNGRISACMNNGTCLPQLKPQSVVSKIIVAGQSVICGLLAKLPRGTSLSISADAQAYGGIGGYLGVSGFIDGSGNTGVNFTRGWGAGFGANGGVGFSLGSTPAPGRTTVSQLQGGIGGGYGGASASYSKAQGFGGSGGISAGPRLGLAAGSVDGVSSTASGGNICK